MDLRILAWWLRAALATALTVSSTSVGAGGANPAPVRDSLAIITNWGADSLDIVNVSTAQRIGQPIRVCAKPYDIKVVPSGLYAYTTCSGGNTISKIDLQANLEHSSIEVGLSPRDISLTKDGLRAVVANSGSDSVSVVDLRSGSRYDISVTPKGESAAMSLPYGVDLSSDEKFAVVTLWGTNQLVVLEIGPTTGKIIGDPIPVGTLPYTVALTDDNKHAIVTCFGTSSVYVVSLAAHKVVGTVAVGGSPWGLALRHGRALVANYAAGSVSLLSINAPSELAAAGGANPVALSRTLTLADPLAADAVPTTQRRAKNAAFGQDPDTALVTDLSRNEVLVLKFDGDALKSMTTIKVGNAPYGVAFIR